MAWDCLESVACATVFPVDWARQKGGRQLFLARGQIRCSGKCLRRKIQHFLQACPLKAGPWIQFSTGGNVLMPCHMCDGVVLTEVVTQLGQTLVLGIFKGVALQPLQLDADRIVVAMAFASVLRDSSMPGTVVAADKLPK